MFSQWFLSSYSSMARHKLFHNSMRFSLVRFGSQNFINKDSFSSANVIPTISKLWCTAEKTRILIIFITYFSRIYNKMMLDSPISFQKQYWPLKYQIHLFFVFSWMYMYQNPTIFVCTLFTAYILLSNQFLKYLVSYNTLLVILWNC